MLRRKIARNRKGSSDTSILTGGRFLLAAAFVILIIFPFFGKRLLGFIGGTGANAYSIDKGFADLITKVNGLESGGNPVPHPFTIDDGFYLVGFNQFENTNDNAVKPPDCNGNTCLCICTDAKCEKIDATKNRGRDCRPIPAYQAIVAQEGIKGNDGKVQANSYVSGDYRRYFYVKGQKTIAIKLWSVNGALYIGKIESSAPGEGGRSGGGGASRGF